MIMRLEFSELYIRFFFIEKLQLLYFFVSFSKVMCMFEKMYSIKTRFYGEQILLRM